MKVIYPKILKIKGSFSSLEYIFRSFLLSDFISIETYSRLSS